MEHEMNAKIQGSWNEWNSQKLQDEDLVRELQEIAEHETEIFDRFYRELEFGTGGLRGVIGAGTNRMNLYTVGKATQGYANYLKNKAKAMSNPPTVAIAYDSRIKSDLFARTAAEVFAGNGIRVFIYRELMPTPALSFAVRYLECDGGIVVTASHNPAKYNGYKVYGKDGGQITSAAASEILHEMNQINLFHDVNKMPFEIGIAEKMISYIEEDVTSAYIAAVSKQSLCKDEIDKAVSIVYTPLNGAGLHCVLRTLRENGFTNVAVVKEQEAPDGNFPTCPYPNPEMKEALELGLSYARREKSELLIATDPDCDRVGIAVRSQDEYVLLTGNEVGMLLLNYICERRIAAGTMPEKPVMVKTIVTIDMASRIATDYGVQVIDVLTGFKFIGEQIGILEKKGEANRYIFGFEESYGYLSGSYVRDKDAVNGSLLICEMFAYYKTKGKSLVEVLDALYETYGYCLNTLRSYLFEGAEGFAKMQSIMTMLRSQAPCELAGRAVISISDYLKSEKRLTDASTETIDLPKSDVLKLELDGNLSVVIRPSGTEPKLKVYFSVSSKNREDASELEARIAKDLELRF